MRKNVVDPINRSVSVSVRTETVTFTPYLYSSLPTLAELLTTMTR